MEKKRQLGKEDQRIMSMKQSFKEHHPVLLLSIRNFPDMQKIIHIYEQAAV